MVLTSNFPPPEDLLPLLTSTEDAILDEEEEILDDDEDPLEDSDFAREILESECDWCMDSDKLLVPFPAVLLRCCCCCCCCSWSCCWWYVDSDWRCARSCSLNCLIWRKIKVESVYGEFLCKRFAKVRHKNTRRTVLLKNGLRHYF